MTSPSRDRLWESGWEGHEREQLRRLADLPLTEKIKWLEEAQRVARHLAGNRSDQPDKIDR